MIIVAQNHWLFAGIVICLLSVNALTQSILNNGIQLTGSVLSVKPFEYTCGEKIETCDFDIDLLLQFRNGSSKPAIVFVPSKFYGDTKVSFIGSLAATATETTSTTIKWTSSCANYRYHGYCYDDSISRLVQGLLTADIPFNDFVVIAPEGYYEWRQNLRVRSGYKLKKERDPKRKGLFILSAIPEHPALKIEYFLSLRNRPEDSNPLEKAKENWKDFGDLLLDSNGDYRFESETILNKLP